MLARNVRVYDGSCVVAFRWKIRGVASLDFLLEHLVSLAGR